MKILPKLFIFGFLAVAGFIFAVPAARADALSVRQGKQLAHTWCATCHVVGTANQDSATAGVVSFVSLAARPGFNEGQLAKSLFSPHPAMPGMNVTRTEITALFDYIISLKSDLDRAAAEILTERGENIADDRCSRCHAISGNGPSPRAGSPPFQEFSKNWPVESLAEALAEGIVVSHADDDMPEFRFEPDEIGAILTYIQSVQR